MQQTHADTNSDVNIVSQDVGLIFVREYYTFLNKQPHRLHAFYSKDSVLVRGDEGESAQTHRGQEEIRGKIEEMGFEDCKVLVTQVDSQTSANEGIIIQVLGEMCNKDEPSQKFSQTFFLARQSNGYYVLNDIFRFLKDEVNIDYYTCEDDEAQHQQQLEQQKIKAQEEQQQQQKKKLEEAAELKKKAQEEEQKKAAATAAAAASAISTAAKSETAAVPAQENRPKETKPTVAAQKSTPPVVNQVKDKKESSEEKEKKGSVQVNGISSPITSPATEVNGKDHQQQQTKNVKPESEKKQQSAGPSKSSGPKTWANMAASSKWSTSVNTTPSQAPKQPGSPLQPQMQQPQQPQSQSQPQPQPQPQQPQPQPQQQQQQQQPQQQQQHQHQQHQHQTHPQQGGHQHGHGNQRREETQIFIKNINQSINEENLREAFSQFGTVKGVNVLYNRNCAFLDFTSTDSVHKALSQHKVHVHNNIVLAEERRHNANAGGNRYQNNRQQQNNRPYDNRRFQQDGHRRGGGAPRGGKSRGGGGGAGGGSNSGTNNGPKQ